MNTKQVITDADIKARHLLKGNLFISRGPNKDQEAERLGYKFIGASRIDGIEEVHIFEIESLESFNKRNLVV